jgi:hypothetical protein
MTGDFYVFDWISNEVQLDQFLSLWEEIQSVFLLDTQKSSLNLSAHGVYSAKSAYEARFFRKIHSMNLLELNLKCNYSSGCSL